MIVELRLRNTNPNPRMSGDYGWLDLGYPETTHTDSEGRLGNAPFTIIVETAAVQTSSEHGITLSGPASTALIIDDTRPGNHIILREEELPPHYPSYNTRHLDYAFRHAFHPPIPDELELYSARVLAY